MFFCHFLAVPVCWDRDFPGCETFSAKLGMSPGKLGKLVPIHLADLGRMARTYAGTHGGTFLTHSLAHGLLRHWLRKLVLTLALLAGRGCELSRVGSQLRRGFLTLKKAELISGDAFSSLHLSPYTHLCCVLASVRKTKCDLNNPGPIGHSVT